MPNWCSNKVTITNKSNDPKLKERLESIIYALNLSNVHEKVGFFNCIKPRPKIFDDDWYDWNVANWGTKWESQSIDFLVEPDNVKLIFDTAWSPPTPIYDEIYKMGLDVQAEFYEIEGGYLGTYRNGKIDSHDIALDDPDVLKYTTEQMSNFIEEHNIEWATKGCLGSEGAYIELYDDVTKKTLCKYPWDSRDSFSQAIAFVMDMHYKDNDEGDSSYANV